jgi:RHS repeat-associated protein
VLAAHQEAGSVPRVGNRPRAENRAYAVTDRRVSIDGNGNLVSDGTRTYTWDARDRLVSNGYGYDTGNLRVKMGTQKVLLDGIEEAREYGGSEARYDHDPSRVDGLLAQKSGSGKGYFVTDALGSVYGVVDASGAVVSKYSYDVYGARTATTEGMPTSWGFTGRRHDEAGEMYYRARYLQALTGGFLASDPVWRQKGMGLYAYVGQNPALFFDPLGLYKVYILGIKATSATVKEYGPEVHFWETIVLLKSFYLANEVFGADKVFFDLANDGTALQKAAEDPELLGLYVSGHGGNGMIEARTANDKVRYVCPGCAINVKGKKRLVAVEIAVFSVCGSGKDDAAKRWAEALGGVFQIETNDVSTNILDSLYFSLKFYDWLEGVHHEGEAPYSQ